MPTAHHVITARLRLRPYIESDAEARRRLIDANDAWLRPWIPWMRDEPMSLDATRALLREHADAFAARRLFRYLVLERESDTVLGEAGLYPRIGPGALEAGYLLARECTGRGYAAEAASALIRVAFEVEQVERVELHCDPANTASVRVAQRLGFILCETRPRNDPQGDPELMVWQLDRAAYRESPACRVAVRALDSAGNVLL